jgi:hypothetical protein
MHAVANTPVGPAGLCRSAHSRQQRPSPSERRVGSHVTLFEACSAFTHVTACMLAESPYATLCPRSVSAKFVASSHRSDCFRLERPFAGWDSHPLEIAVFARHTLGYGFADEHVNAIVRQGLAVPSFKLVIVDPSPTNDFVRRLKSRRDRRVWILSGVTFGTFTGFVEHILPDLRDEEVRRKVVATWRAVAPDAAEDADG